MISLIGRWLFNHSSDRDGTGNCQVEHRVRTHAHATLSHYLEWTEGERSPPADLKISAHTARVWYALAGGLQWQHDYNSSRTATFSALADARAAWIGRVLENAGPGFESVRAGTRVQLRPRETDRWLDWIGEPVPGVEHKWAESQD